MPHPAPRVKGTKGIKTSSLWDSSARLREEPAHALLTFEGHLVKAVEDHQDRGQDEPLPNRGGPAAPEGTHRHEPRQEEAAGEPSQVAEKIHVPPEADRKSVV